MNDTISLPKETLYRHWASETPLLLNGRSYRVGRMSYGDYFLEPGTPSGENDGFNLRTIWPTITKEARRG